jgi:hypothetical protein
MLLSIKMGLTVQLCFPLLIAEMNLNFVGSDLCQVYSTIVMLLNYERYYGLTAAVIQFQVQTRYMVLKSNKDISFAQRAFPAIFHV